MEIIANALTPPQFHALRSGCGLKPIEPGLVERALSLSLLTLCAKTGDTVAGAARLVGDGALMVVLCDVMVLPEYRRRGIGGSLISAALDWAARGMPEGRWMSVMLTCAAERKDYYKKFGFMPFDAAIDEHAMRAFVKGVDTGGKIV